MDASSPSGCGWTAQSGSDGVDWDIDPNSLIVHTSNTLIFSNTEAASGTVSLTISADVVCGANNDEALLVLKATDSSNYWFARFVSGASGSIKVGQVVSGTPTVLASTSYANTTGNTYRINLCYGNGGAAAWVGTHLYNAAAQALYSTTTSSTATKAGVGGATITGSAAFSNVAYAYGYDATSKPECNGCNGSCTIFTDAFSSGPGSDWDQLSGTWSGSGKATTSDSFASLRYKTGVPSIEEGFQIRVTGADGFIHSFGNPASPIRIIVDFIDNDNFLCAEFHYNGNENTGNSSLVRIISKSAGTETELLEEMIQPPAGVAPDLGRCVVQYDAQNGRLIAGFGYSLGADVDRWIAVSGITLTSHLIGLGTGDIQGTDPSLKSFECTLISGACDTAVMMPPCETVTVTISGMANNTNCSTCTDLDGTYELRAVGRERQTPTIYLWRYDAPPGCSFSFIYALYTSGQYKVIVTWQYHYITSGKFISGQKNASTPPTCGSTTVSISAPLTNLLPANTCDVTFASIEMEW
jgi:hypothetical protein